MPPIGQRYQADDDGAASHLVGMRMPSVPLAATDGTSVDLSSLPGRVVVYAYPRTGIPGVENPAGWDLIPGARGCYAAVLRFPRSFCGIESSGRQSSLRTLNPGHCLSARGGGPPATSVSNSLGRTPSPYWSVALADLPDERDDVAEAPDPRDPRRKDRARLLSGFSAGPECERCHRMAHGQGCIAGKSRPSTTKTRRLKSLRKNFLVLSF